MNVTSPDINVIDINVILDISGVTPKVSLENNSTGANLANVKWVFEFYTPSGTAVHVGDFNAPDKNGVWANADIPGVWPLIFGSIEFSQVPYKVVIKAKDSADNVFTYERTKAILRPPGNVGGKPKPILNAATRNNFGVAKLEAKTYCETGQLYVEDRTNYAYDGQLKGVVVSKVITLAYPPGEDGVAADPFTINNSNSGLIPFTYSSPDYRLLLTSVIRYDFGNGVFVQVKYKFSANPNIQCNIDLCPLFCEVAKIIDSVDSGKDCTAETKQKLLLINSKLNLAFLGKLQPLCGIDVAKLVDEIKVLGNFDCNCCVGEGINGGGGVVGNGNFNFSVNATCGDIDGGFAVNGNNIVLTLNDKKYTFVMHPEVPTQAFSVTPSTNGCIKTYALNVSLPTLATDLLNTIKNNAGLVNLFNSIVGNQASGNFNLVVDGKCIINTAASCDYTFKQIGIPQNADLYALKRVNINGVVYDINISFNSSNGLSQINDALAALNKGVFAVSMNNIGGQAELQIVAENNVNAIDSFVIVKTDGQESIMSLAKECEGAANITANQIVQAIINYICAINTAQIKIQSQIKLCVINDDGTVGEEFYNGTLQNYLEAHSTQHCKLIEFVNTKKYITCKDITDIHNSVKPITQDDTLFGKRGGDCGQWSMTDVVKNFLTLIKNTNDPVIKNLFCDTIGICSSGSASCSPVPAGASEYDGINLNISFANNGAGNYKVAYRVWGSNAAWTEAVVAAGGGAGTTTNVSYAVPPNRYETRIIAMCGPGNESVPFYMSTQKCADITVFNVVKEGNQFKITYGVAAGVTKVNLVIEYPNGGGTNEVLVVADNASPILRDIPAGVYGSYFFKIRSVCHEANAWYGDFTNTIEFLIQFPHIMLRNIYGVADTGDVLSQAEIDATLSSTPITGGDVTVDYTLWNADPKFLWFAERISEPIKTKWEDVVNPLNNGSIGGAFDLFAAPVEVGGTYRFYITNYATQFVNPVKFKVI